MRPYYQDEAVTLYCGDCREILPSVSADVMVTDPPYGIGWKQNGGGQFGAGTRGSRHHEGIIGDEDTSARDAVLAAWTGPAVVFGSFRAPFPVNVKQTLVFRKSPDCGLMGSVTGFRTDAEPIFLIGPWPLRTVRWSSVLESRNGLAVLQQSGESHPHEKPSDVLRQLISACPDGVIIDPFMGGGSTLRAAKDEGRLSIGIEIEERYCEIAAKRCAQGVLNFA